MTPGGTTPNPDPTLAPPRHRGEGLPAPRGLRGIENQVFLVVVAGAALISSLLVRRLLPEQYLWDDGHLQQAMDPSAYAPDAASFETVAAVYVALGLADAAPLAALGGMLLFVTAVFGAVRWQRVPELTGFDLLLLAGVFLPATVYLAQYSKELATLLVALVVVLLPAGATAARVAAGEVVVVAAAAAYGATLRPYWLIIAVLYVVWRWLLPRTSHPLALLAVPVLAFAALQPAFRAVFDHGLQGQRDWANAERADVDVNTVILSIAPEATGALGVAAAVAMVGLMVVPVDLLLSGSPFHLLSGVAMALLWLLVLVPVLGGRLVREPADRAPLAAPEHIRATRAASLLLAFLLVQALFEPDYGSALKHLTPMLPLVLMVHLSRRSA